MQSGQLLNFLEETDGDGDIESFMKSNKNRDVEKMCKDDVGSRKNRDNAVSPDVGKKQAIASPQVNENWPICN